MFAAVALVAAGILFRLPVWHLPLLLHHYGGGLLWGAMVYALAFAVRPPRTGATAALVLAALVVVTIEGSRLIHTSQLDTFRTTLAGQWLLGRIFSPWNILVDSLGAAIAAGFMAIVARKA